MEVPLRSRLAKRLRTQLESGMGYQRVRVRLRDGRVLEHAVVLNGRLLQLADDVGPVTLPDIVDLELEPPTR